ILIEHYAGHFPTWLAPQQVMVVPVHHEKHVEYAEKINALISANGYRSKLDARNEKLGYRIREAQLAKIPYQLVIGDGEQEQGTVTIRRAQSKESQTVTVEEFLAMLSEEVKEKRL
ncbi:MAG: His/Gly/Thr/Pro-type tRNA ligase C-terminal domain-containing protein, partial [Longicatena sp.]